VPPSLVHFNGSVNLPDAETVMREICARIPAGVTRIPDGETGERGGWILFQLAKFIESGSFREVPAPPDETDQYRDLPTLELADGVSPAQVRWPDPGYSQAYLDSYTTFRELAAEGVIGDRVRFQVEFPTPMACLIWMTREFDALRASYEKVLFADLGAVLAAVPAGRLAVQWDVAVEFYALESSPPEGAGLLLEVISQDLARCIDQVPADIPAGLHLCYGDLGHSHFMPPPSLARQCRLLEAVTSLAQRPVSFASFTVPQDAADPAYFAPLAELRTGPQTELYFSLVPYYPARQEPGTTGKQVALIDAALTATPAGARPWGVSTECGMGRVDRADVTTLLDQHAKIIAGDFA
jgi:hypothetical protein